MATEIERKFLLAGDGWRKLSLRQERRRGTGRRVVTFQRG